MVQVLTNAVRRNSNNDHRRRNAYAAVFFAASSILLLLFFKRINDSVLHGGDNYDDKLISLRAENLVKQSTSTNNKRDTPHPEGPIELILNKAQTAANPKDPFRVLYIVTSLSEYDKGTRGTTSGSDRLANVMLPVISDGVQSMVKLGWQVDVYLILGFEKLLPKRRDLIVDALPDGVGLQVWENAIPYFYSKRQGGEGTKVEYASHGLSRQHRYVLKDKLMEYDFFACFEDDMRITSHHILNYLEMSTQIEQLRITAEHNPDGMVHVPNESKNRDISTRDKSVDKAMVGNDMVDDAISGVKLKRLIPGFIRVEVMDRNANHPLKNVIDKPKFSNVVPPSTTITKEVVNQIDPDVCCDELPPGRGKMTPNPTSNDLLLWETNIQATGVRHYPPPLNWVAAMPVEDRADVGSYWSGYKNVFGTGKNQIKRPRRVDATLGQQAGFMATRSQIEYFHKEACPGGFLPPFDDEQQWKGDSLQRHSVEFWSGGFQLFGQCFLNRVLSLDIERFQSQMLYHVSNNKQRTITPGKFIRVNDFLGQIYTVKERAEASLST